ncbi:MAG: M20/M25/M40 family metallo-hydrolase [Scrofimicrobium sp.]
MADKVCQLLREIDYFKQNPQLVQKCTIESDEFGRAFVYGLLKRPGTSKKTIILMGHLDVVGLDGFGNEAHLAFSPDEYTRYLLDHPDVQIDDEARADLTTGDWLFGRGVMDMKFGLAACLEVMRQADLGTDNLDGNLLFLGVPDEEANSVGMRAAVDALLRLRDEHDLEYECCLVTEPEFPGPAGDEVRYLYNGTIGKLLPVFYCVGNVTHVANPFSGLNPDMLTSKIVEKVDLNPQLCDASHGEVTPVPICLKQADTKAAYNVQTPYASYAYFNWMTLTRTPQQVMATMRVIAEEAFRETLAQNRTRGQEYFTMVDQAADLPEFEPKVVSYQELYQMCVETHGEEFEAHIRDFMAQSTIGDMREATLQVLAEVHRFCPYKDPIVILCFAPPFYPHTDVPDESSRIAQLSRHVVDHAQAELDEHMRIVHFFPGLSDMSYLGLSEQVDTTELEKNFPVWDAGYTVPLASLKQLRVPVINVGPVGKDPHKNTERLWMPYALEKAAPLIWETVRYALLDDESRKGVNAPDVNDAVEKLSADLD